MGSAPDVQPGDRYIKAVAYATELHRGHVRKGTSLPYLCHLLAVSASVLEAGGDEDLAIAALLHDGPEDCGGQATLDAITTTFGPRVGSIVEGCSDSLVANPADKAPWRERKTAYIAHLAHASDDVLMVVAADKLHNTRAIVTDLDCLGVEALSRFNAPTHGDIRWFYRGVLDALLERNVSPTLTKPLTRAVEDLESYLAIDAIVQANA